MRLLVAFAVCAGSVVAFAATRSPEIPFAIRPIDNGASETAAVADINHDGRLDIVSGESWYEAPGWTKHRFREINFTSNYFDNFSDLPIDVDGDGYPDITSVSWFAKKIAWWKNPGKAQGTRDAPWTEADVNTGFNIEFATLADIDNDGKALEIVAQENGTPQSWYEVKGGTWVKHVISDRSYGHGIGAGDVNKDGRNDILTPRGWLEAPADPRAGNWAFHADFEAINVPPAPAGPASSPTASSPTASSPTAAAPQPAPVLELGFMHVVDVNSDGRNDVVTAAGHNYGVFWFEQGENGRWTRRVIDNAWSQGHASTLVDLNGDGRKDFVTGKRFMAHNGSDPGEKEPLGVYWYEFAPASAPPSPGATAGQARAVPSATSPSAGQAGEWIRHVIDYGGRVGGGVQMAVIDIDGDGDLDIVCPGKSGLFLVENLTKGPAAPRPSAKAEGLAPPKPSAKAGPGVPANKR